MNYSAFKEITIKQSNFISHIQEIDGYKIESFSYRLAGFQDFETEYHKNMRGIAFIYGNEIETPKLFTMGVHKFFNYWEWFGEEWTINLLKTREIESIDEKLDGSQIMFWKLPNWKIIAKTKSSINSNEALLVNNFISNKENYIKFIDFLLENNMFPSFEYTSLNNRIVLLYPEEKLTLLQIRRLDWKYLPLEEIKELANDYSIPLKTQYRYTIDEIFEKVEKDTNYEGFVVNLKDWNKVKMKLKWYVNLHILKDSITNKKNLIEAALYERLDDFRTLCSGEQWELEFINKVEKEVFSIYNKLFSTIEIIYQENKELTQKDFAWKMKDSYYSYNWKKYSIFSLLMAQYSNKLEEDKIKQFILKNITSDIDLEFN